MAGQGPAQGYPAQSRTFSYKEDAEKWVRDLERAADTGGVVDRREAEKTRWVRSCSGIGLRSRQPRSRPALRP